MRILVLLAASFVLFFTGTAGAQSLTIGLEGVEQALPMHVCVLYAHKNDDLTGEARRVTGLRTLLERTSNVQSTPREKVFREALTAPISSDVCGAKTCQRAPSWRALLDRMGNDARASKLWMRCARNGLGTVSSERLLLLELTAPSITAPDVFNLKLQGDQISVVLSTSVPTGSITATSWGGDYEADRSSVNDGMRITLTVPPLCEDRDVTLPSTGSTPLRAEVVYADASDPRRDFTCRMPRMSPLRVRLPRRSRSGQAKTLMISLVDEDEAQPTTTLDEGTLPRTRDVSQMAFVGRALWLNEEAPQELLLRPIRVRFTWAADPCLYDVAENDCPEVNTTDGTACQATTLTDEGRCTYTCPGTEDGRDAREVSLPLTVQFTVGTQRDAWRGTISGPDQVLSEYANRDERQFGVDFSAWSDTSWKALSSEREQKKRVGIPGDYTTHVEIFAPDGSVRRLVPADGQRVTVPGVACGDVLQYRLSGSRDHKLGYTTLRDGKLAIPSPERTIERWELGGYLAGGVGYDATFSRTRPYGIAQLSLRYRPPDAWRATDLGFELDLGLIVTAHAFRSVAPTLDTDANGEIPEEDFDSKLYLRPMLALGADIAVSDNLRFGGSSGFALGFPLAEENYRSFGGLSPMFIQSLITRYDPGVGYFSFEGAARLTGPQRVLLYRTTRQGPPEPVEEALWIPSFDIGARFWF